MAGNARGDAAAVLAFAPEQPRQRFLWRRSRWLHQGRTLERLLVRIEVVRRDPRCGGSLPGAAGDPRRSEESTTNEWLQPVELAGTHVRLEPLRAEHADGLRRALADGELWRLWYTAVPTLDTAEGLCAGRDCRLRPNAMRASRCRFVRCAMRAAISSAARVSTTMSPARPIVDSKSVTPGTRMRACKRSAPACQHRS